jgi:uncharacterized membrane protein YphA (DoxX/SURF4 family)
MLIRRIARPLLSAAFIGQGVEALRNPAIALEATEPTVAALRNLPDPYGDKVPSNPETAARINAAVQIGGGLLLATGKMPRIASAALAFTVIPGSLGGHLFWTESDPERKAQKRRDLLTDLSLLGGLIIAAADTAGKPSLGWRGRRAAGRISEAVSAALPLDGSDDSVLDSELADRISHGLHAGAERGRELASTAAEKSAPVVKKARKKARKRGAQLAEAVREHGAELADTARERGGEWADIARERGSEWADIARERGGEFGERAYERGSELAETARERTGELAHRGRVKTQHWH